MSRNSGQGCMCREPQHGSQSLGCSRKRQETRAKWQGAGDMADMQEPVGKK